MSQTQGETTVINGTTYLVRMLPPRAAAEIGAEIVKTIGPSLGSLSGTNNSFQKILDGKAEGEESDPAAAQLLSEAIRSFLDRFDFEQSWAMVEKLASVTDVKQGEGWPKLSTIFDLHFLGKPKQMYQWLVFSLKTQMGDFF
jgi:hypothetical protein